MGSEGYFINEFLVAHTNKRDDEWGGDLRKAHAPAGGDRAAHAGGGGTRLHHHLPRLDAGSHPEGQSWDEVVLLAKAIERAGATLINTGIGWHEARVPTIATSVPRAAFAWVTRKLKGEVSIPLIATNRINTPEVAERIIAEGSADMISMARPLLADPEFVVKAAQGRAADINTCIGCNQACLDHVFQRKLASCL
jgi:2,4-dienoyl-CoA reductase (NADPH2)